MSVQDLYTHLQVYAYFFHLQIWRVFCQSFRSVSFDNCWFFKNFDVGLIHANQKRHLLYSARSTAILDAYA